MVLLAQPLMQATFSPLAGRLSDRVEPRVIASSGMGLTLLGLLTLTRLGENSSLGGIVISLVLLGLGFALFSSPNTNAIMGSVERRYYGVASGVMGTMRLLGQMLSMGIVMLVFSLIIGKVEITPEHYPAIYPERPDRFRDPLGLVRAGGGGLAGARSAAAGLS